MRCVLLRCSPRGSASRSRPRTLPGSRSKRNPAANETNRPGCGDELRHPRQRPDLPRLRREEDHEQEEEQERERANEHGERGCEQAHESARRPPQDRDGAEPQHEVDEPEEECVPDQRHDGARHLSTEEQRKQGRHEDEHDHLRRPHPSRDREERLSTGQVEHADDAERDSDATCEEPDVRPEPEVEVQGVQDLEHEHQGQKGKCFRERLTGRIPADEGREPSSPEGSFELGDPVLVPHRRLSNHTVPVIRTRRLRRASSRSVADLGERMPEAGS